MAWCPGCSYEYKPGTKKKCPQCGHSLPGGPGLTSPVEFGNRKWFSIRSAGDSVQAEMLRSFLESNGFDVTLRSGNGVVTPKSDLDAMMSEIQVLVPDRDASSAAGLIRANNDWASAGSPIDGESEVDDYDLDGDDREFLQSNGITADYDDEYYCY